MIDPVARVRDSLSAVVEELRSRIAATAASPFAHAPYPLSGTLQYRGDPGLLGPGSVSWHVIGDVAAFVGGIRGLLIQAAHPEVVAGVGDHSRYREDPLGRLSRTSAYVTATTYGAMPEVEAAVDKVRRIHRVVSGVSSRGVAYDAREPEFAAWVHNALTDSFLVAHRHFGGIALTAGDADQFVVEQTRVGALLGSDPMPMTSDDLSRWVTSHPDLAPSSEQEAAVAFLTDPPLATPLRVGYRILMEAALATIPERLRLVLGVKASRSGRAAGSAAVSTLRWALGYSPSWRLALERCEAPVPAGLFREHLRSA